MALENGNSGIPATMLVGPANGYMGYNGGGFGGLGGDWGWIVLLLLLAGNGGWGFGGGFGGGFGNMALGYDFPWLLNGQNNINANTNNGFRDAMLNDGINGIRDGINGISTQLCNGFNSAEIAANGRQMADMQQMFALQSSLQNCCCENRLGIANLGADIAREACATRANSTQNTQSILNVITGGIQSIKDQLCQDKIDAKDDIIAQLRQENLYAKGQASQVEQTARILAGQAAEIDGVYNRLKSCPVPSMPVYGMNPIFTCGGTTTSCGCGSVA